MPFSRLFKYHICLSMHMNAKAHDIFISTLCCKSRLHIIQSLRQQEKNVTELSKELKINQTTLSHNLQRLQDCGMVTVERRNKYQYYRLNKEYIEQIMSLIEKHMAKYCQKSR